MVAIYNLSRLYSDTLKNEVYYACSVRLFFYF